MNAVKLLTDLGFVGSSIVNDDAKKNRITVKVWTSRGWDYQKFDKTKTLEDDITAWSRTVEPGVWL